MSDFVLIKQQTLTTVGVAAAERPSYSLDDAARLADVHPDLLRHYCRAGLLGGDRVPGEQDPVFDDDALYELRRIEHYRRYHGVNLHALPLVLGLLREIENLQAEVRFLRRP